MKIIIIVLIIPIILIASYIYIKSNPPGSKDPEFIKLEEILTKEYPNDSFYIDQLDYSDDSSLPKDYLQLRVIDYEKDKVTRSKIKKMSSLICMNLDKNQPRYKDVAIFWAEGPFKSLGLAQSCDKWLDESILQDRLKDYKWLK